MVDRFTPRFTGELELFLAEFGKKLFTWLLLGHYLKGLRRSFKFCGPSLGALHGSGASTTSKTDMKSLRTAFCSAASSSKMPVADAGAVLSLQDGPNGCDPEFQVTWSRFRLIRRYLAFRSEQIRRIYETSDRASVDILDHSYRSTALIFWT